jgi:nucleoside-diphosphate-sugar epimerase
MAVVVIGASGYLGEYVTEELLSREYDVIAFDLAPSDAIESLAADTRALTVERGDMCSFAALSRLLTTYDVEGIIQLAYYGTPENGLLDSAQEHPYQASNANVEGFNNVVEASHQFDVESVVWASSTVVYGPPEYYERLGIDTVDEDSPTAPQSVYGACKVMNEHIANHYRDEYGMNIAGIRLPLIYGPNRYPGAQPFIVEMFDVAANGGSITLSNGETTWDLLYERDVGPLFASVLESAPYDSAVYNIYGHTVTVAELAELARDTGHSDTTIHVEPGSSAVLPAPLDDSRFRTEFSFEPSYDAEAAVDDYLRTLH